MTQDLLALLGDELAALARAAAILRHSFERCTEIGVKMDCSIEELDQIEAFISRFARVSDIVVQKFFRLINRIELEAEGTIRDRINQAEKKDSSKTRTNLSKCAKCGTIWPIITAVQTTTKSTTKL